MVQLLHLWLQKQFTLNLESKDFTKGMKKFYYISINKFRLDAALLRQVIYGTARMGLYFNFSEYYKKQNGGENLSFT